MDARSRAFVAHVTQHRVRIKIPHRQGQYAYFAALQRLLAARPDVTSVHVNALVASIVIHCRDGFEMTSMGDCFAGLELVLPASDSPAGPRARQIVSTRTGNYSTSYICLISLAIKLAIAIATRQLAGMIREWIVEAVVRSLLAQLYRKPVQLPRLERPPVAAAA
jgi:hypothetical protein